MVNKYWPMFVKGIFAGIMISIGAMAYLTVDDKYVGSMVFTIGLFTIYTLDFYLFTGKVGYFFHDKDAVKIGVVWLGNVIGTSGMAMIVKATRMMTQTEIYSHAVHYSEVKLGDTYLSMFILAMLCGIMMFIGAESYITTHDNPNSIGGYIGLFLCVMIFLLLGFEHSIANVFYFTMADAWNATSIIALLVVSAGNAAGGILFNECRPKVIIPHHLDVPTDRKIARRAAKKALRDANANDGKKYTDKKDKDKDNDNNND